MVMVNRKIFSKPDNRVDELLIIGVIWHMRLFPDTKTRSVAADRITISELNETPNATMYDQAERALIKPIVSTKANSGLLDYRQTYRRSR